MMKMKKTMMRKTRKHKLATDRYFEFLFEKGKELVITNWHSKLAALKIIAIVSWFKDIN